METATCEDFVETSICGLLQQTGLDVWATSEHTHVRGSLSQLIDQLCQVTANIGAGEIHNDERGRERMGLRNGFIDRCAFDRPKIGLFSSRQDSRTEYQIASHHNQVQSAQLLRAQLLRAR